MINIGIIGGAGYTAGELLRILVHHPEANIVYVHSHSHAGEKVTMVHQDLEGETELIFSDKHRQNVEVLFLCMGHGKSRQFLEENTIPEQVRIIDLSHDFRLQDSSTLGQRSFVYGLPELNKENIRQASNIANPGCFATGIQLALLPLAAHQKTREVHVHAITGSTGAGQSPSATSHFSWRNNNMSTYKVFSHQHLGEIRESLTSLQATFEEEINFIPVRGNFTRGIFVTAYLDFEGELAEAQEWYESYYASAVFTHISNRPIHLKQVVNTNKCLLHLEKHGGKLVITSIIDNLTKGASGQAVHNMNLMFGLDEHCGLRLKANMF